MRHGKAQTLKNDFGRGGSAKTLHTDHRAVQAHILAPVIRSGGFNGNAGAHAAGQHAFLVGRVLRVKNLCAGHGDHAGLAAVGGQLVSGFKGKRHF